MMSGFYKTLWRARPRPPLASASGSVCPSLPACQGRPLCQFRLRASLGAKEIAPLSPGLAAPPDRLRNPLQTRWSLLCGGPTRPAPPTHQRASMAVLESFDAESEQQPDANGAHRAAWNSSRNGLRSVSDANLSAMKADHRPGRSSILKAGRGGEGVVFYSRARYSRLPCRH
jgi:hypothetical protein